MTTTGRLRQLLAQPGIIRSLGAHDVFTALLIEQAGLETVFLGGFGAAASRLGLPDLGFLTLTEMADAVAATCARLTIPAIADGDTGHGDLPQVQRTVALFEQAGAAGLLLEDQVSPKRCGHFAGKDVIDAGEMVLKLKAAQRARRDPDLVLIARTDARAVHGLDDAIDRANRYGDAGADVIFVEAPESVAELEALAARVRYPQLINMLVGGKTPILSADELAAMGFKLMVCPVETLMVCATALRRLIGTLLEEGRVDGLGDAMIRFDEVKQVLGVEPHLRLRDEVRRDAGL